MNVFRSSRFFLFRLLAFAIATFLAASAPAQTASPLARQIPAGGQGVFQPQPLGGDGVQAAEIDNLGQDADNDDQQNGFVNRTLPSGTSGNGNSVQAGKKAKSNPQLNFAFDGLNFRQQRLANHGNQFSVEPPDQGLCAGNGFILESTNDVLDVFDASGNQLLGVTDLNSFYGYAPAVVRHVLNGPPAKFGPSVTDPSCLFDVASQRWFHVVLTLDRINVDVNGQSTSQSLSGLNHLDIAVSNTPSPLGAWTIYRIPVQDDGTQGTPDHDCLPKGTPPGRTNPNACLGDYPHIGADANGFYITTNEFCLFTPNCFNASQLYAISKSDLANNLSSVTAFQYDTNNTPAAGLPGFTVWPAQSPSVADYATQAGGTEYFLSSFAVFTGLDNRLALWALTNTQALNSSGAPTLSNAILTTVLYANPPRSNQPGSLTNDSTKNWPLGQCIENAACDFFLNGIPFGVPEKIGQLNSNDSRLQQVMLANGKLWGALGTGLSTDGVTVHAGIAYFVILPQVSSSSLKGKMVQQGYVALDDASLTYPSTAATSSGRGVISFTVVGPNTNPSVGYVSLDAIVGAGDVHVAQLGSGLQDGFTEYNNIFGGRPRWGDYGAAAVVGNSIWFATEYINQSCDLATYEGTATSPFGSCGGTRASLGNWATRITKVTP